ncbi:metabolite traffic protein EboE [Jidongwangia harbinensis]|uniref:metabolite traffic protein EboE n=1 Tax=Jidongwangia harbinensis TaxID=2878561 RepID=UPI001CD992D4|nr:metabolite traffic protein EboE [Jidongwangia harbinensis]MCA2218292.1 metabolite traffic protein EboE [Jidongwangia harbinensis]
MRFVHPDGTVVHLSYSANVHAAAGLDALLADLSRYAEPVRHRLGADRLGLGVWFAPTVAAALLEEPRRLHRLRAELQRRGLEVVTLHGTPYAEEPVPAAKREVYAVDWSRPERLAYTLDLVRCLARLLPDDARRGSVSTLPIAWRRPWFPEQELAAARHLAALPVGLRRLAEDEGRPVRVGFEPAAGCVVENAEDAARLLDAVDREWVGVCLDACHQALTFADVGPAVARLAGSNLSVVKAQISAALTVAEPSAETVRPVLRELVGSRFPRQVRERSVRGVRGVDDLEEALDGRLRLPGRSAWRIHYHLPVHRPPEEPFGSTDEVVSDLLRELFGGARAVTDHLEIETYTWRLRRGAARPAPLVENLAAEIDWTRRRLTALGLAERAG